MVTSVAMMHSFFSSAITNTDWYMESLLEHMVDILHSGLSLENKENVLKAKGSLRRCCGDRTLTCTFC